MSREIREVVADIDAFPSSDPDVEYSEELYSLAVEYFALADAPQHLDVWFRLYERYPTEGGHLFWSILHGIEAQPNSNECVVASVRRKPTVFTVMMVGRMLNGGIDSVDGLELIALLRAIAADDRAPAEVRKEAEDFIELHSH